MMTIRWRAGMLGMGLCALLAGPAAAQQGAREAIQEQPSPPEQAARQQAQNPACPPALVPPTQEMMQAAMQNAKDRGFLWRITKDGHTSYLYGTMHVGKLEWTFPGPTVREALRASDTMALELDVLDPQIQAQMRQEMAGLKGFTLPDELDARLRRDAAALCVPWESLAGSPPELQIVVLDVMAGREEGLDAAYAVDGTLAAIGHASHQQMVSLETPAFQMHALLMKTREETIAYVEDNLDELESASARVQLKRLATAWAHSDYADMARYPEWCECLRTPEERAMMKRMLDERNPAMADKIDALHREGRRVFAAVGSMHMFGPAGLPALLRQKGYAVERVELGAGRAGAP
jgi:uncharacterized protein YbaP (TraB family)